MPRLLQAGSPDFSKEAVVVEKSSTLIRFSPDGISNTTQSAVIDIQSASAVQSFGVLSFTYDADTDKPEILYVRVRKPDGTVVETPPGSAMDQPSEVATVAPMYSDARQKQIPVKSLAVGDVLEYSLRTSGLKAEIPGQFWFATSFNQAAVSRSTTLDIFVPKDKYVKVVSPKFKPVITDEQTERHYAWTYSYLQPTNTDAKKPVKTTPEPPDIALTTFRSWDEVGQWYAGLVASQAVVTPAIAAKAAELTKGLTTPEEKAHAIYNYVAMKFRYISISLGQGRYQPHKASDVLDNGYGDCKDKHTLFTALLKAAGIDASTVLIGYQMAFDPEMPAPMQFNHVITALPESFKIRWADATSEFAPFGLLLRELRGHSALLISTSGKTSVVTTSDTMPFAPRDDLSVDSNLAADGVLKGHFDWKFRGDTELLFRTAFHQIAPVQWQQLMQNMLYTLGFAGDVSNVTVDNVDNPDQPLVIRHDYNRKDYSDWANHRIAPPLPRVGLPLEASAEKPVEPVQLPLGEIVYRAKLKLPEGFALTCPDDVTVSTPYGDYQARYSFKDGVLTTERQWKEVTATLPDTAWDTYKKLAQADADDHGIMIEVVNPGAASDSPQAQQLLGHAAVQIDLGQLAAAGQSLKEAEAIAPKQHGLWSAKASLAFLQHKPAAGQEYLKRELELHPDEQNVYPSIAQYQALYGDFDGAAAILRDWLNQQPHNLAGLQQLGSVLVQQHKWDQVLSLLEPQFAAWPDDANIRLDCVQAWLHLGQADKAQPVIQKLSTSSDPRQVDQLAALLANTGTNLDLASKLTQQALSALTDRLSKLELSQLQEDDLIAVNSFVSLWDTLGWIFFKQGDLHQAESYLVCSWMLSQGAEVGDHLAQVYLQKVNRETALKTWQLAIAANPLNRAEVEMHFKAAGGTSAIRTSPSRNGFQEEPREILGRLRRVELPGLPRRQGSGEYWLLIADSKLREAASVDGEPVPPDVLQALRQAHFDPPSPDDRHERIVRRAVMSCSQYTKPNCELVMLQTGATHKSP